MLALAVWIFCTPRFLACGVLKNRGWIVAYWLIKTEPSDYSFAQLLRKKRPGGPA